MNIGRRQAYYEQRGFEERDAAVNVLIELALQCLSSAFPDTFVCFGGATLVLFFGSSRVSADLDLLVSGDRVPTSQEVISAVSSSLSEATQQLNLGNLEFATLLSGTDHFKISIASNSARLFTIDVTRISGTIHSEVTTAPLSLELLPGATASLVTRNWMLLQKLEAFLTRRVLKARDAFDIKLLLDSGAVLNDNLKAHLSDGRASERLVDPEFIRSRIAALNASKCELELRPVLPQQIFERLRAAGFAQLRQAVAAALADWLEE